MKPHNRCDLVKYLFKIFYTLMYLDVELLGLHVFSESEFYQRMEILQKPL